MQGSAWSSQALPHSAGHRTGCGNPGDPRGTQPAHDPAPWRGAPPARSLAAPATGQQRLIDMGIVAEPIVDQRVATHTGKVGREHGSEPLPQRRAPVHHIAPVRLEERRLERSRRDAEIALEMHGPTRTIGVPDEHAIHVDHDCAPGHARFSPCHPASGKIDALRASARRRPPAAASAGAAPRATPHAPAAGTRWCNAPRSCARPAVRRVRNRR